MWFKTVPAVCFDSGRVLGSDDPPDLLNSHSAFVFSGFAEPDGALVCCVGGYDLSCISRSSTQGYQAASYLRVRRSLSLL